MRVKLRLYTRDLDLIALKYIRGFRMGEVARNALAEYVRTGTVCRCRVPVTEIVRELPAMSQVDISLPPERYQDVIDWLLQLRPYSRCAAVKTIIRAAIENPPLWAFGQEVTVLSPQKDGSSSTHVREPKMHDPALQQLPAIASTAILQEQKPAPRNEPPASYANDGGNDDELDLFDFDDFDNF